jgi:hypothetical protein
MDAVERHVDVIYCRKEPRPDKEGIIHARLYKPMSKSSRKSQKERVRVPYKLKNRFLVFVKIDPGAFNEKLMHPNGSIHLKPDYPFPDQQAGYKSRSIKIEFCDSWAEGDRFIHAFETVYMFLSTGVFLTYLFGIKPETEFDWRPKEVIPEDYYAI